MKFICCISVCCLMTFQAFAENYTDQDMDAEAEKYAAEKGVDPRYGHSYSSCFKKCMMKLCVECGGDGDCDHCTKLKGCKYCKGTCMVTPGRGGKFCAEGCAAYALKCMF